VKEVHASLDGGRITLENSLKLKTYLPADLTYTSKA